MFVLYRCFLLLNFNSISRREVHFASLLSGGFTTFIEINPPDWKLGNRTFVVNAKINLKISKRFSKCPGLKT